MKGWRYVFCDQAGSGEDGSASAGVSTGDGGNVGGESRETVQAVTSVPAGSGVTGKEETALAAAAQNQTVAIPEKYQVKKEDGSIDIEASSLKLAEAYTNLEKRIGTGDIPPKTAEEYVATVPESLKEAFDLENDEAFKSFRTEAHKMGMTQAQFDFVMSQYFDRAPALVSGAQQLTADECVTSLKSEWKTEADYKAGVGRAYKAAVGYFGDDAEAIISTYGNDPRLIRGLARIGEEMQEDSSINTGIASSGGEDSIMALQMSEAYKNPKHPEHAKVSKQVQQWYSKQAEANAKTGALPIF